MPITSEKGFSNLLIPVVVVLFLILGVVVFAKSNFDIKTPTLQKDSTTLTPGNPVIKELSVFLNENSGVQFNIGKESLWWVSDDDWNILDKSGDSVFTFVTIDEKDFGDNADNSNHPLVKKVNELALQFFKDKGFEIDKRNSSDSESDKKFYDYIIAFKKGEMRCTSVTNADITRDNLSKKFGFDIQIICADQFKKSYEEQTPYLKAIKGGKDIVITDIRRQGDYAYLNVHYRRTGHVVIGKFEGGKFKEIISGQDSPTCILMEKERVPKEIYGSCYREEELIN